MQDKAISYLFYEEHLRNFIENNNLKFIEDKNKRKFVRTIIKFYKHYNKIPNIDEYEKFISKLPEYQEFVILFQKLSKSKPIENYMFLIDQLKNQYVKNKFSKIFEGIDFENINLSDVQSKITKLISDIEVSSDTKERFIYENVEERFETVDQGGYQFGISSGFSGFDKITGGFNKKELYLFFGRVGIGKTRVLFNFAYNLAAQKYTGMFFSLEMYLEQMERIFDSRFGDINSEDIKYARVDKKYYRNVLEEIKEKKFPLYIVAHNGKTSVEFIENKIREFKKKYSLDFVVIDYLTLMSTGRNLQRDEEYGEISKALKNIAKRENIIVITAAQANRKTVESESIGLEHIGYSDQIAHNADFVAYIKRGKIIDRILDIMVVKNREGISNTTVKFLVDFGKNIMKDTLPMETKKDAKDGL
jgi:replicative DNA helicase